MDIYEQIAANVNARLDRLHPEGRAKVVAWLQEYSKLDGLAADTRPSINSGQRLDGRFTGWLKQQGTVEVLLSYRSILERIRIASVIGLTWRNENGVTLEVVPGDEIRIYHSDFPGQPLYWKKGTLHKRGMKAPVELSDSEADFIQTAIARLEAARKEARMEIGQLWHPALDEEEIMNVKMS